MVRRVDSFTEGYRQNIAVLGEPLTGKTALLKRVLESGALKNNFLIPVYIEIKTEPFDFCAKRFIKACLFQMLRSDPVSGAPHDALVLIEDLKNTHPLVAEVCRKILHNIDKGRTEEAYSYMLDIPSAMSEELKKKALLIIDEFHNIGNFPLRHPFGVLAKKIITQKDVMFVLASSREAIANRILSEKLSLLFGNFERIYIPPLDLSECRDIIARHACDIDIPPLYADFISSFTGKKPFYIQAIAEEAGRAVSSERVDGLDYPGLIEYAFTAALFKKGGTLNNLFSSMLYSISNGKALSQSTSILIALCAENKKQIEIVRATRLQRKTCSRLLNRLAEIDIIARNGSFFRFKDRLFAFWLKSVYLRKLMSFSIDNSIEETYFGKDIRLQLGTFITEFEKDLSARVYELFRLFKNDFIQLNGRRHKFPVFKKIEGLDISVCDTKNFVAHCENGSWLCTIKDGRITESEMSEILNLLKAEGNNKIKRKVLIVTGGLDENAHLMAKESRFWIWDAENLNILMELYGKPQALL
jgi:hypothetical protein